MSAYGIGSGQSEVVRDGRSGRLGARAGAAQVVLLLTLIAGLGACAVIRIEGDDGTVRVERQLGFVSVNFAPEQRAALADVTALGIIRTWDGLTVGYYAGQVVALPPDDCRIVVWVEDPAQVAQLRDMLKGRVDVCVFPGGQPRGNDEPQRKG